ncbi:MAG: energy-coupling factor ABC transporter ATP-binding protein [Candidatus Heimdallarchaeota archaeon]
MNRLVISIKNLYFKYLSAKHWSLLNITLKISRGEFVLITGPTGSGKSTLVRCLNGLIPHFYPGQMQGTIQVLGIDPREKKVREMAGHVGFVFQNTEDQLFSLSVERELVFSLENLGLPKEEIKTRLEEVIEALNLSELLDKRIPKLSGGQKQKVAIAAALAMKPEILVLDEPLSELDPRSRLEIISVLDTLKQEDLTIVLVEHRLHETLPIADKLVLLVDGELLACGEPRKILMEENRWEKLGISLPLATLYALRLPTLKAHLNSLPLTPEELVTVLEEFY